MHPSCNDHPSSASLIHVDLLTERRIEVSCFDISMLQNHTVLGCQCQKYPLRLRLASWCLRIGRSVPRVTAWTPSPLLFYFWLFPAWSVINVITSDTERLPFTFRPFGLLMSVHVEFAAHDWSSFSIAVYHWTGSAWLHWDFSCINVWSGII